MGAGYLPPRASCEWRDAHLEDGEEAMILDKLRMDGKVAIVTGAGRGLGRAMAVALAEAGADIVAAARTEAQLEETAELVKAHGRRCPIVPTDVTDSAQVNALVERAVAEFSRIDILVNNAGGATAGYGVPLPNITDDEWRVGIDTNLTSVFYCTRAAIRHMLAQGGGKIVNIASGYGLRGGRDNYMYASSKAGVINFTRSLALTYGANNIQANCIAPGLFPHSKEMEQMWRGGKFIPMGRFGRHAELGPLLLFLCSELSDHVNGETIVIDGGGTAGGQAPTGFAPSIPL
jgi:NAD(P)-dependent dehydrogenase (short-subunit alcohol dehydrogenase family)